MSTSPSDTETLNPELTFKDRYGNPISVTVREERQKENTTEDILEDSSEDSLDNID